MENKQGIITETVASKKKKMNVNSVVYQCMNIVQVFVYKFLFNRYKSISYGWQYQKTQKLDAEMAVCRQDNACILHTVIPSLHLHKNS